MESGSEAAGSVEGKTGVKRDVENSDGESASDGF